MSKPSIPESQPVSEITDPHKTVASSEPTEAADAGESFGSLLSQFEKNHAHKAEDGSRQLQGVVIAVSAESVFLDIGYKTEGILPLAAFQNAAETPQPGDTFAVSVKGRDEEGYYTLSRFKTVQPTDWSSLQQAFAEKATIVGTVSAVVKGGLHVDVGVRAFMPASRSGTRDATEMEKLVGQEIRCRILKLEVAEEDVVVDRRAVLEEEERSTRERRYGQVKEGETVSGTIRSLADYGAFVDLGGVDGLLHVSDIAWGRVNNPADVLTVGQQITAKVLKIDTEKKRISLGMKQLQPHPWDALAEKYKIGERVRGTVMRLMDFGAFVELEPGIEGLIHLSEMSWAKKVRKPGDLLKTGDTVEAVILAVSVPERRISLGLKQALGDPWSEVLEKFSVGSKIEGPVTSITKFGAFVQLSEGVEGMVHVSEISADKHIHHPQDVLKVGQVVQAQVMEIDSAKRQLRLSIKQMIPTSLDEYIAEHKTGDIVTGRIMEITDGKARVELGEGLLSSCNISASTPVQEDSQPEGHADLSSLTAMLNARWKSGNTATVSKQEATRGQIRNFRITQLDADTKKIALELA